MPISARNYHTSMDSVEWMAKRPRHAILKRISMGFLASIWAMRNRSAFNEPEHRKVSNRPAIFLIIFPNSKANQLDRLTYRKPTKCHTPTLTYWRNANYCCTNTEYVRTSSAATARQWSELNYWRASIQMTRPNCSLTKNSIDLVSIRSESAKLSNKPTSWPRSRIESHAIKTSREKRKPQSSSPSSRHHPSSMRRMKRFQKSTAIYTLPIRGKQQNGTPGKTGNSPKSNSLE